MSESRYGGPVVSALLPMLPWRRKSRMLSTSYSVSPLITSGGGAEKFEPCVVSYLLVELLSYPEQLPIWANLGDVDPLRSLTRLIILSFVICPSPRRRPKVSAETLLNNSGVEVFS